jgi:phosphoglycolate phosphatase-like HAD superfamily hydrolase
LKTALSKLCLIVLDFDGVIVESNDVKTEAFREVFARFPEHAEAMLAFHHANASASRYDKFDRLLELLGRSGDANLRTELAAEFTRRTLDRVVAVPLVPGAEEFLREASARVPLYLASVTPAEDLETILDRRGLRRWFRGVYGCPPWTKPEAIRDALRREGCVHDEALLVGDSEGDRRAAAETGIGFIARDSGLLFADRPRTVIPDLTQLSLHLHDRLP